MTADGASTIARLYRGLGCGSAMVEAAFALAGQPLDTVTASRWQPQRLGELEAINPLGQVPTLVWPDGTVQSECAAILIETALRFPRAGLLPDDPASRAEALRWLIYLPTNVYVHYTLRDFPERWSDDKTIQAMLVDAATARIGAAWALMAAQFVPRGPFAFGAAPGALDIAIAVMSKWTPGRGWFARHCPYLATVAAAVDAHPVLVPVWTDNFS